MPNRVTNAAVINRGVNSSANNTVPPRAASTGTDNCTVAAWFALKTRSAAYQTVYPSADARAPDATAQTNPAVEIAIPGLMTGTATSESAAARTKFPVVAASGSTSLRPSKE